MSVQLWISMQPTSLSYAACDSAVVVEQHMWHFAFTPASMLLHMKRDIAEGHCSSWEAAWPATAHCLCRLPWSRAKWWNWTLPYRAWVDSGNCYKAAAAAAAMMIGQQPSSAWHDWVVIALYHLAAYTTATWFHALIFLTDTMLWWIHLCTNPPHLQDVILTASRVHM